MKSPGEREDYATMMIVGLGFLLLLSLLLLFAPILD